MKRPNEDAELMLTLGRPLEATLWLFSPPPNMTSEQARKGALKMFVLGFVLMVAGFAFVVVAMKLPSDVGAQVSKFGLTVTFVLCGGGYLLMPAAVYRLLFGIPEPGFVGAFFRAIVGIVLFLVFFLGSLVVYGQLNP